MKNLGLPNPVRLDRYVAGSPLVDGHRRRRRHRPARRAPARLLDTLGIESTTTADPETRYRGLVFDATGLTDPTQLVALRDFFAPLMRSLRTCARLIVLGTPPEQVAGDERIAQRALEGFTRSLGKEVGRGGTAQLVYVVEGAEAAVGSTLGFLLSPKSAYVSGQVVRIGTSAKKPAESPDWQRPLAGKVALVTGAARGIGEQIARVLARDGATVVGVDVPAGRGRPDPPDQRAGRRLPDARHHRQGRTRSGSPSTSPGRTVASTSSCTTPGSPATSGWPTWTRSAGTPSSASTWSHRSGSPAELLAQKLIHDNGRIIGVASIAGIAGNLGQTNYAASKAGVIGLVDSLEDDLTKGITVNAVAPGFIETKMTAAVPFATREVGRRMNSLSQGGLPVDVAETIAWFASPASTAVNGNVVRVCGQMMLGA